MATGPSENPSESREAPSDNDALGAEVKSLRTIIGDPYTSVPEKMPQTDIDPRREEIMNDYTIGTYQELNELNALNAAKNRLQRLKEYRKQGDSNTAKEERESVVVNQAVTYHEYFPEVVNHVYSMMAKYEARRSVAPAEVVRGLAVQEKEAQLYIAALNRALQERVAFANILLAEGFLRLQKSPSGDPLTAEDSLFIDNLRKKHLANPELTEASRIVLGKRNTKQNKIQGNELNQRIIDILAGKTRIAGVSEGFLPQQLYLDLLAREYDHTLEKQIAIARDPEATKAQSRMERLQLKNDKDGGLPKEELEEYKQLQQVIRNRNSAFSDLHTQRAKTIEELVQHTNDLGEYQVKSAELSTLQHQFGALEDPDAKYLNPDTTPEEVRQAIAENMEQRSDFHLGRLGAFTNSIEEEVLDVGLPERIEDASIKTLRPLYLKIVSGIGSIVTIPVPEAGGVKARVRKSIVGDLAEAMGWPLNSDGTLKEEKDFTAEEIKEVKKKMTSIKDAIESFDRTKITNFRETMSALHKMPKASEFINKPVKALPTERITPQNMDQMIETHGGPAVYIRLFQQLEEDWGDHEKEPSTGLIGESERFLKKVDANIGTHLDVGKALHEISEDVFDFTWQMVLALIGAFAAYKLLGHHLSGRRTRRIARQEAGRRDQSLDERLTRAEEELADLKKRTGSTPETRSGADADGVADSESARKASQQTESKLADADLAQKPDAKAGADAKTDPKAGGKK